MRINQKKEKIRREPHIIFASQRQYEVRYGRLLTVGPIGAETGENYRELFPNMTIVGRATQDSAANVEVLHTDFYLVKLDLRSPWIIFNFFAAVHGLFKLVSSSNGVIARAGGLGSLVAMMGFLLRKPVGIEVGGCVFNSLWNYGNVLGKIAAPISYLLRCTMLRLADRVQMVTQDYLQRRYFMGSQQHKCTGISNVAITRHDVSILEGRRAQELRGRRVVLGSIGSFNGTFKGHDQALRACNELLNRGYSVELWIIGGGSKESLRRSVKRLGLDSKVRLFDPVPPGEAVEKWLSEIDIYCQFSRREGISRALIEAMNVSLPVVASNAGGTYELVDSRSLFEIDDVKFNK